MRRSLTPTQTELLIHLATTTGAEWYMPFGGTSRENGYRQEWYIADDGRPPVHGSTVQSLEEWGLLETEGKWKTNTFKVRLKVHGQRPTNHLSMREYMYHVADLIIWQDHESLLDLLQRMSIGIWGESGEYAEKLKKLLRGDVPFDRQYFYLMAKELGDIAFYLTAALWTMVQLSDEYELDLPEYTLEDLLSDNLNKLWDRRERNQLRGSGDTR